jgi:hypothetical protein
MHMLLWFGSLSWVSPLAANYHLDSQPLHEGKVKSDFLLFIIIIKFNFVEKSSTCVVAAGVPPGELSICTSGIKFNSRIILGKGYYIRPHASALGSGCRLSGVPSGSGWCSIACILH